MAAKPFWHKPLADLSATEWERLCDGCGLCCLHKIEDEDTEELFYTRIACSLLDIGSCRCTDYTHRLKQVPECLQVKLGDAQLFDWLPQSCAYRLRHENQPLPDWHPLVCGDPLRIHREGVSVRAFAVSESEVSEADWCDYVIE